MSGAREKLQRASKRVTTVQEDVAYSLFGIFGITLPIIYGERKQSTLGWLLQEIVARSGDITVLDWIGQPSEFNSCLPAYIASYSTTPRTLSSLRRRGLAQETLITYGIKADGPHGLLITTQETLDQFSREKPIWQTFLPVRPWDRYLLGVPDFADDMESMEGRTEPGSLMDESDESPGSSRVEEEPSSLALQLLVHPRQPFD
ncbi:uncharacterized protein F5147DRAFT_839785 [Suillus discolor]|uniref:Uncharacterized protein n=1 Tax=Suillus discolor TaxID=1912936 RepID=A0A9P7EXZ8_9AGAM|nr:uncharacterized protein F5147DRAFT_839785 [Suillus discolor]KAG2097550.1 hypothetical protein F5147DRAFT_839785 [Suillus discolor]